MKRAIQIALFVFFFGSLTLAGCGGGASTISRQATMDAISAYIRLTSTAQALKNQNPNGLIETAQAEATVQAQAIAATQGAQESSIAESQAATKSAIAPILAKLPTYGADPDNGHVEWIHPPVQLEVQGFMKYDYVNYFIGTLATDFVISTDITWDAIGSASSCGFVLRSDGNKEAMNTYLATISRVATGHFVFLTVANGQIVTGQDIYAYGRDPAFDWQNKATNNLTVVGRGNKFSIYTNGTFIGDIDPSAPPAQPALPPEPKKPVDTSNAEAMANYVAKKAEYDTVVAQIKADYRARLRLLKNSNTKFDRGFMALVALSQSGTKATCQFNNAWLWMIGS